ncbi:MAG TPA: cytochrome c-type biogenesis protein [Gemmatimonadaceae bacterium]
MTTGTGAVIAAPLRAQNVPVDTTFRVTSPVTPADSALEARTAAVSAQLRCPVCQGESIEDSPSELSAQMRRVVKDQLRAGKTPDQVKAYFVSKYGEWILLDPEAHGFNLVLYAAPYVLLLAGLGVIVVAVRRWTRAESASAGL